MKELDDKTLTQLLEKGRAIDAYHAVERMIADPKSALAFLERKLQAAAKVEEKAQALSEADVFHLRAIQALERIGTKDARQLLQMLARGDEQSPRTRAAGEALRRIEAP